MFTLSILFLTLFFKTTLSDYNSEVKARLQDRVKLNNELNREYKQAMCCKKKLKCCNVQLPNLPNIEIKAILVHCPNARPCAQDDTLRRKYEPICATREHNIRQFEGFDEDEPLSELSLKDCRKKLMITIRISKHEFDPLKNHYIIVDHVYDPTGGKYTRIFTPYILKIRQEPTTQMYGLKFLHVVNSKAREKIFNKRSFNYKGCDVTSVNPTCGKIKYNGESIPYSEGFCCSCDQITNYLRQPQSLPQVAEDLINYGDSRFLLGGLECPKNLKGSDNINQATDLIPDDKSESPLRDEENSDKEWVSPLKKMKYHNLWSNTMTVNHPNSVKNYTVKIYTSNLKSQYFRPDEGQKIKNKGKSKGTRAKADFSQLAEDSNNLDEESLGDARQQENIDSLLDYVSDQSMEPLNEEIKNLDSILRARKAIRSSRLERRQVQAGGIQKRGGQNCADRFTPKDVNPITYHESAHCLRFSDLWYTVYHLKAPIVDHAILFQIFVKQHDLSGKSTWSDITRGKIIRVSSISNEYMSEAKLFSIKYVPDSDKIDPASFALNYKSALLLIPEGTHKSKANLYPEAKGGPGEYLIIHASQVTMEGDQCDVAGVGFEGFVRQSNRCSKIRGSCLANQPYDLWLHDHQAEKLKLRGCFFLKNFGVLPEKPIKRCNETGEKFLILEYKKASAMKIDLEIKSDFNAILRKEASAKITEIYVDSSTSSRTTITIKVTNTGLVSSKFMTRLADCPLEVPAMFNNIHSKFALIPPQHQHSYRLEIKCALPWDKFHCSIETLNYKFNLVALRRIRLQKFDRCICTWHCLCACTSSFGGLGCIAMSSQHYHAAGFQGSLPITSFTVHYSFFDDALTLIMYIAVSLVIVLLFLGLCKAVVGLCCIRYIGNFGLNIIFNFPKPLKKYHESELKDMEVSYDSQGYPINPMTKKRARNISVPAEFCINIIFFFVYPLNVAIVLSKRVCCPQRISEEQKEETMPCLSAADYTCDCKNDEKICISLCTDSDTVVRKRSTITKSSTGTDESVKLSTIISIQEAVTEESSAGYTDTEATSATAQSETEGPDENDEYSEYAVDNEPVQGEESYED